MAVLNLSVTIPDAQLPRVQNATRATFGQVPDGAGGFRDMTNAEIVERIRQEVIQMLKGIVRRHERAALVAAAEAPIVDVDAT